MIALKFTAIPIEFERALSQLAVSWNSLDRFFRGCPSPIALQSQFLIAVHHVRPEWAAVFGSGYHG